MFIIIYLQVKIILSKQNTTNRIKKHEIFTLYQKQYMVESPQYYYRLKHQLQIYISVQFIK
ncbi:hypothetical protein pb186bvf_010314 [Paramecium bursaria]